MNSLLIENELPEEISSNTDDLNTRIIIIEDDEDVSSSVRAVIELDIDKCIIKQAFNLEDAEKVIKNFQAEIALIDIKLGANNGLDLIPVLKESNPHISCVVMTAFRDIEYTVKALRFGAHDFLYKPIEPVYLLKVIKRLIERTNLEKQLQSSKQEIIELNLSLEKKIKDKTAELESTVHSLEQERVLLKLANTKAEAASKAKSEFLTQMSHELRTPLNAILGFAQLLQYDPKLELDELQNDNLNEIIFSGKHLLDMIQKVLELSNIESGKLEVNLQPVQLSDLLTECFDIIKLRAEEREIELIDLISSKNCIISVDVNLMKQVLLNLLINAIKYNKAQGKVTIKGKIEGNFLTIEIIDTGEGLTKEQVAKLFTPFEKLNNEYKVEGAGIGLTLVKKQNKSY